MPKVHHCLFSPRGVCVPIWPENRKKTDVQFNVAHSKINLFSVDPGKEQTVDILAPFAFALWRSWHLDCIVSAPCLQTGDEAWATSPVLMGTGLHWNQMAHPRQIYYVWREERARFKIKKKLTQKDVWSLLSILAWSISAWKIFLAKYRLNWDACSIDTRLCKTNQITASRDHIFFSCSNGTEC